MSVIGREERQRSGSGPAPQPGNGRLDAADPSGVGTLALEMPLWVIEKVTHWWRSTSSGSLTIHRDRSNVKLELREFMRPPED